ncbi:hypothetical protein IAU60_006511 [Kwoniella sp. DSM 27419]
MSKSATSQNPNPADVPADDPNSSRFHQAKVNLKYLAMGSAAGVAPASLTTRTALTTTRYAIKYLIKRLIRYAKYAFVGAAVAAIGGTFLGTIGSGLAFFAAPSIGVGMGIGVITGLAKFGWRHRGNHFRSGIFASMSERANSGHDGAADEASDAHGAEARPKAENRAVREDVWMRA